jgi:radical SAM protein with 4Fe4S-binding SPASM domain
MYNFVRAFFYTTTACQFNCEHCFVREERKKFRPKELDLGLAEQFIYDFYNPKYNGFKESNITGVGNPLLYSKLHDLIALLRRFTRGEVSINCRGKIKDETLYVFRRYNISVYYSMDYWGKKADKQMRYNGLWDDQKRTLAKMVEMRIPVRIRTTIMRDNIQDCMRFLALVKSLRSKGVDAEWHGMPYLPYISEDNLPTQRQMELLTTVVMSMDGARIIHPFWSCIYPPFAERVSKWIDSAPRVCEAARDYGRICLTQDGEVTPCPFETHVLAKYEKTRNGWVLNKDLFDIERKKYLQTDPPEFCKNCSLLKICKGGCRIHQRLSDKCVCPRGFWGD